MEGEGEEGEGEMYGESNMETYIAIYKVESQCEFAEWLRELKEGLSNNLQGWDREEVGGRGHMYTYGYFMLVFGRKQLLQSNYPSIKII